MGGRGLDRPPSPQLSGRSTPRSNPSPQRDYLHKFHTVSESRAYYAFPPHQPLHRSSRSLSTLIKVLIGISQVPASLSPANFYSSPQMSESVGPSQMYHQSNLTMPDMGLAMGMKPEASPPTPRSLRLMPNTSGPAYGQSTEELRRVPSSASGNYMTHENMQAQHMHHTQYGSLQDRSSLGGLPVTAAAMAAAKKKGIKSSLGRLFSKKEKVSPLSLPNV